MALFLQVTVMTYASTMLAKLHRDERGQDTLEWVLMGGLIAGAIVGVGILFDTALTTMVGNVADCVDFDAATACDPGW